MPRTASAFRVWLRLHGQPGSPGARELVPAPSELWGLLAFPGRTAASALRSPAVGLSSEPLFSHLQNGVSSTSLRGK